MRNTLLLLAAFLVLSGLYLYFFYNQSGSSMDRDAIDFSLENPMLVDEIIIQKVVREEVKEEVILDKKNSEWIVNGNHTAMESKVQRLFATLQNLNVENAVSKDGRKEILKRLKKGHIKAEFYSEGKKVKGFYIGGANKDYTGNYMLLEGKDQPYIMSRTGIKGYISIYFSQKEKDWRELLAFEGERENIEELSIIYSKSKEENSFTIKKGEKGKFEIQEHDADFNKLQDYMGLFKGKVLAEALAGVDRYPGLMDKLRKSPADITLTIKKSNGEDERLELFVRPTNPDNYFAIRNNSSEVITVQKFVLGKYLKEATYFISSNL